MRPWLERHINSNKISGLIWIDKEKSMFAIPWKHAARHGWTVEQDATVFKLWAEHTGKHMEGAESNPKTWKANFRCALHSLPDVEEVKDQSVHKGQGAMRVYRILRDKRRKETKALRRKVKTEEPDPDYEPSHRDTSPHERTPDLRGFGPHERTQDLRGSSPHQRTQEMSLYEVETFSFEVSPERSPDSSSCDYDDITLTISQPLDKDGLRAGSSDDHYPSPEGRWSDLSSGQELDLLFASLQPSATPPADLLTT
ncbi:unnamed protein product [Knipowitschia caucasica]